MKKIFILFFAFVSYGINAFAFSEYDAKQIASEFYKNIKLLSSNIYPNKAKTDQSVETEKTIKRLFLSEKEECKVPDEIGWLNGEGCKKFSPLDAYVSKLSLYTIANGHIDFIIDFGECTEVKGVSRKGDQSSNKYFLLKVKKRIKAGLKSGDFEDVISIDPKSGKIFGIGNELGGYNPQTYTGDNYDMLMAKATNAYEQGNYKLAYDTYLKVVKSYSNMCDPYYRLALMVYFKKGIKGRFNSRGERKRAIRSYLRKAMSLSSGRGDIYRDAYNLEYTLDNALV